ncbi:type III-B CRISPR-associated protein Cas10/Cmr2 [Pyrinomonas methylaliphatogenes]|uniref:CRISPR-associated protein Cas10/Cmr2, subtype III-B n=1 Tax=Pyrinomonas methylaliphatogenes TaxID=454194 RepID=A0A0B6X4M9_9BACT|nr:type III-B CRISPR-associated protein Cas10/Cmr2 [Pyrinomonas methylaliphatogenes]CDM67155.1 CRISPR-associated protein Cas10/Cmr2, subtype III-B [Pyrinomonas methylaliphatogenes]
MLTRWTLKIIAFLHDPPGKALVLRSAPHTPHDKLAEELQCIALGHPATEDEKRERATEKKRATKADHIASAADRVNFPGGTTAYWDQGDQVGPKLTHPLAAEAQSQPVRLPSRNLQNLDNEVQTAAGQHILQPWVQQLTTQGDKDKYLYFRIWRLLYEELARRTSLKSWVRLLPADTRQPDHPLEQHLSISAAIADALPNPAFLVFSIGPVQEFIAAARRTQDLWMGSWILSYLSWKAMESLANEFGPDVIVFPSLRGQPLCDRWLHKDYGLPCQPMPEDLSRPTFPNRFLALLPASEAESWARKAERAVRSEWERLVQKVYDALKKSSILPADQETDRLWQSQIESLLEVYWVVFSWPGANQSDSLRQADEGKAIYEKLCAPPQDWEFQRIYETVKQSGQYDPNWGTVYSLFYDLADRAFNARKNLRNFGQAEETGDKCTQCGQRAALHSSNLDSRDFWARVAENLRNQNRYEIKPHGKERLCAVCTVKRFIQREVLEQEFGLRGGFPSISEIAAVSFKKRVLDALKEGKLEVRQALKRFLDIAHPRLKTVARGAVPYLEKLIPSPATGEKELAEKLPEKELAEKLLEIDGEWLHLESWTREHLEEIWPGVREDDIREAREALRNLYQVVDARPSKYYAVLYMDGDHMGRWLSGTHEGLATFGDTWHPSVRNQLANAPNWQGLAASKRVITPAVHASISQALGRFALQLVPHIVEERHPGRLIYAGGDDVLALVPLEEALAVARELRAAFSGHIRFENGDLQVCLGNPVTGYVEWGDDVFLTMGPEATASIGLVFAHHLQPLDMVLQAVRRAEHTAKHRYGRNALAVEVLKRSGETITVGTKWSYDGTSDVVVLLIDVTERLQKDKISGKWAYTVHAEVAALEELPAQAQRAELKRLLKRQAGQKLSREEKEAQAEDLSKKLVDWAQAMGKPRPDPCEPERSLVGFSEMSRWLLACSFIARGGEV